MLQSSIGKGHHSPQVKDNVAAASHHPFGGGSTIFWHKMCGHPSMASGIFFSLMLRYFTLALDLPDLEPCWRPRLKSKPSAPPDASPSSTATQTCCKLHPRRENAALTARPCYVLSNVYEWCSKSSSPPFTFENYARRSEYRTTRCPSLHSCFLPHTCPRRYSVSSALRQPDLVSSLFSEVCIFARHRPPIPLRRFCNVGTERATDGVFIFLPPLKHQRLSLFSLCLTYWFCFQ